MQKMIFDDEKALYQQAAELMIGMAKDSVEEKGSFNLVLAGGQTPQSLYQLLSEPPYANEFPWQDTHFFWGDERCVPRDHEHSNFRAAHLAMLNKPQLHIPLDHIHPMVKESLIPEEIAAHYEKHLKAYFDLKAEEHWPVFDLVLLGMGNDGHTLSLFPGKEHYTSGFRRWVVQLHAPEANPPGHRISLTIPVVNQARHVMFLVTGKEKRPILREIWNNQQDAKRRFPAALIEPKGVLMWLTDQAAGDIYQP